LSVLVVSCFQPFLSRVLPAINVPFRDIWHKLLRYATSSVGRELALNYSPLEYACCTAQGHRIAKLYRRN
jgi:hypothetical protein